MTKTQRTLTSLHKAGPKVQAKRNKMLSKRLDSKSAPLKWARSKGPVRPEELAKLAFMYEIGGLAVAELEDEGKLVVCSRPTIDIQGARVERIIRVDGEKPRMDVRLQLESEMYEQLCVVHEKVVAIGEEQGYTVSDYKPFWESPDGEFFFRTRLPKKDTEEVVEAIQKEGAALGMRVFTYTSRGKGELCDSMSFMYTTVLLK
jgi:hypothetical protein